MQHADATTAIAEYHQVLSEDSHAERRNGQITRERHRLPEPAQIFAARRPGAHLGQLRIRRRGVTAMVAVERTGRRLRGARSSSLHGSSSLAPTSERSQAALDASRIGAVLT